MIEVLDKFGDTISLGDLVYESGCYFKVTLMKLVEDEVFIKGDSTNCFIEANRCVKCND